MSFPGIMEYKRALEDPDEALKTLKGLTLKRKPSGDPDFRSGNFAVVFHVEWKKKAYAMKCFIRPADERALRSREIHRFLEGIRSPHFVEYRFLEDELWVGELGEEYPVALLEWVAGQTLGEEVRELCAQRDRTGLEKLYGRFIAMAERLLALDLAHGDLKHDNIMVRKYGELALVDYDGMYVPALKGRKAIELGSPAYQHPRRGKEDFHAGLDHVSLLVIGAALAALTRDPGLYAQDKDEQNLLLNADDLRNPGGNGVWHAMEKLGDERVRRLMAALRQACGSAVLTVPGMVELLTGVPAAPNPQPVDVLAIDLGGGVKLEMVWIPPGSFMMGSPKTEGGRSKDESQHQVTLTKGYWMGKYPVTQAQWEQMMENNPSHFKGFNLPVENVSWGDCQEFIAKLNCKIEKSNLCNLKASFRLPTEAEWEYVCRAGTTTPFHYGNSLDSSMATFDGNFPYGGGLKGEFRRATTPVGSFKPNAWGLYDMHGNVWEWCCDGYAKYSSASQTDPEGSGLARVLRGGSWLNNAGFCRSAIRRVRRPSTRLFDLGFRVVYR